MVMEVFRTIIVPASKVDQARTLAATVPGGEGMFTAGISVSGKATHYISSGLMPEEIPALLAGIAEVSELQPGEAMGDRKLTGE